MERTLCSHYKFCKRANIWLAATAVQQDVGLAISANICRRNDVIGYTHGVSFQRCRCNRTASTTINFPSKNAEYLKNKFRASRNCRQEHQHYLNNTSLVFVRIATGKICYHWNLRASAHPMSSFRFHEHSEWLLTCNWQKRSVNCLDTHTVGTTYSIKMVLLLIPTVQRKLLIKSVLEIESHVKGFTGGQVTDNLTITQQLLLAGRADRTTPLKEVPQSSTLPYSWPPYHQSMTSSLDLPAGNANASIASLIARQMNLAIVIQPLIRTYFLTRAAVSREWNCPAAFQGFHSTQHELKSRCTQEMFRARRTHRFLRSYWWLSQVVRVI